MRNVGAVILAAGGSSRLGQPKQLLEFRGETLVHRAVRAAAEAGCAPVLVVVGETGAAIREEIRETSATIVENAEWRRGIGTSIRCGLEQMPPVVEAVVLLTCDQLFLDASIVGQLIAAQEETGKPIVASSYANTLGVPALFQRSCFNALLASPDETGAKPFMLSRREEVASVPFPQGDIDVDTPEDLRRLAEL